MDWRKYVWQTGGLVFYKLHGACRAQKKGLLQLFSNFILISWYNSLRKLQAGVAETVSVCLHHV